jgi:hypothetical protein
VCTHVVDGGTMVGDSDWTRRSRLNSLCRFYNNFGLFGFCHTGRQISCCPVTK